MARKRSDGSALALNWTMAVASRLRPPFVIVLGSPRQAADCAVALEGEVTCFQFDLFQAERLQDELRQRGRDARVVTAPDLWDLPAAFQTAIYPAPQGGERALKLDLIEQTYHVLRQHGSLVIRSPYEKEQFFPAALKKVFGRYHAPGAGGGAVLWAPRSNDRPRRRHEVTFQVHVNGLGPLRFLSRPGTFAYGRFDDGARALVETMVIEEGDRILDLGCGCGANGIIAGLRSGAQGSVTFVDSDVRAVALAEHNARANGLTRFQTIASSRIEGLPPGAFDVALANPPYYAQASIARLFIERAFDLLKPGGRLYLVTRQPNQVVPIVTELFGDSEAELRRGYLVVCPRKYPAAAGVFPLASRLEPTEAGTPTQCPPHRRRTAGSKGGSG
jgi:16S rRNA (guanine1207-N2)-methyltransferase